ncbi:hypothetical protein COOONC_24627, partial [Cooperia oncophora]
SHPAVINDAPVVTPAPEVTETYPPITYPPETPATEPPTLVASDAAQHQLGLQALLTVATQYPLTTTCVMYMAVPASSCVCLPQYDQCAQNICCLKAKFRSHKVSCPISLFHHKSHCSHGFLPSRRVATSSEPTEIQATVDMLMNILKKIKTKLND